MKKPGLLLSLVPVLSLIALLMIGVSIFGDELTSGPSQIAIFGAAVITCLIGLYGLKVPWSEFEDKVGSNLKSTSAAVIILLSIGAFKLGLDNSPPLSHDFSADRAMCVFDDRLTLPIWSIPVDFNLDAK